MNSPCAIVTGGSRGIGAAIVRTLAADGFTVYINYLHRHETASALQKELCSSGYCALLLPGDVSQEDDVQKMMDTVLHNGHTPCLLVNNAGISCEKLLQDTTTEDWDTIFNTNVKGSFLMTRAVLPNMIQNHRGNIINISSMWGQVGASCEVAYSAAKAALIGMTKGLAKEVGPSGIRVNCVAPGMILTDMTAHYSEDTKNLLAEETPLCRNGTPEDIARAVSFLAGEKSSFITGQILPVNGGFVI